MFRELILWLGEFACIIVGVLGAFGQCRTLRSSIGIVPSYDFEDCRQGGFLKKQE